MTIRDRFEATKRIKELRAQLNDPTIKNKPEKRRPIIAEMQRLFVIAKGPQQEYEDGKKQSNT